MNDTCDGQERIRLIGEISLTQRLADQREQLEQRLLDIKRAQEILDEHPTLAELHNLLMRIR